MSSKATRSPLRGLNLIIAAALIALFAAFGVRMWRFFAASGVPSLLEDLPQSRTEADQQLFQSRLAKRFHVGSTEVDDLIDELRDDGFTVDADKEGMSRLMLKSRNRRCWHECYAALAV